MRCSFFKSLGERDAIDPTKKQPILPPQRKIQSRTKAALLSAPGENPWTSDVKAAIYWYEKAANQGSVYAMYQAGYVYYTVPIDYNKAGQWFSLAAEKGNKDAEDVLRNHLRYNRFTKKWDAIR